MCLVDRKAYLHLSQKFKAEAFCNGMMTYNWVRNPCNAFVKSSPWYAGKVFRHVHVREIFLFCAIRQTRLIVHADFEKVLKLLTDWRVTLAEIITIASLEIVDKLKYLKQHGKKSLSASQYRKCSGRPWFILYSMCGLLWSFILQQVKKLIKKLG